MLQALKRPEQWRQWAYVGIWIAAAILTKLSGFVVAVAAGITLAAALMRLRSPKLLVQGFVAMISPVLLMAGWWFVRNQALYGDPGGWAMFRNVFSAVFRASPLQWSDMRDFFNTQFSSFWGVFGWMNVWAPSWFYTGVRALALLACSFFACLHPASATHVSDP